MGHLERGVAHLTGLLTEDRPQEPLFWGLLGLTLGSDLPHEHVTGTDLGPDPDDAALVEIGQDLLGQIGDVPGDLLGSELGVPGVDLVLLDVDRGEHVVTHEPLREDDGVLEVVALPGHEGHEEVLPEGQLAVVRGGPVGQHVVGRHPLALVDDHLLVDGRVLVRAPELGQGVTPAAELVAQAVSLTGAVLHHDVVP